MRVQILLRAGLLPELLKDDEFRENMQMYTDAADFGYPDINLATEYMAMLCDNAYRRY